METINRYQHVRLRPDMYGLHDNYFHQIFTQSILDLLHEYSFSLLKISADPKRNQVVFEASERVGDRAVAGECWSFIMIAGISSIARFSGDYKDGSFRRTVIKETEEIKKDFDFHPDPDLEHLECCFTMPEAFPVDENYVLGKVDWFSKIFPHCRIIYNDYEYKSRTKNKMTHFLLHGLSGCDRIRFLLQDKSGPSPVQIYEFHDKKDSFSWEVSFTFIPAIKETLISRIKSVRGDDLSADLFPWTFINGIRTIRGGTHVACVTKAIEQVFRQTENVQDIQFENMTLAVSVHLPSGTAIHFDSCRCCENDLKLISEHPEFKLMERNLKSQIIKHLSETTERGAK